MKKILFFFFVALCVQGKSQVFLEQEPDSVWLAIENNWVCEITPYENRMEAGYKEICLYSKQLFFADTLANDLRNYFNQAELYELQQGKVIIHSNGFTLEPKPYAPIILGFLNTGEENFIYEVENNKLIRTKVIEPRHKDAFWIQLFIWCVLLLITAVIGTILSLFRGSFSAQATGSFIAGCIGIFASAAILSIPAIAEITTHAFRAKGEAITWICSEIIYIYAVMKAK